MIARNGDGGVGMAGGGYGGWLLGGGGCIIYSVCTVLGHREWTVG